MKKVHLKNLEKIGLTGKQAKVYAGLLSLGEGTVAEVAKAAKLTRPTTYNIVAQLESEGIVAKRSNDKKELLRALSPYALLERRRRQNHDFESFIPELLELSERHSTTPKFSVIAGSEGIEHSLAERLNSRTDILFWANNSLQFSHLQLAFGAQVEYMKQRIKRQIWTKGLIPYEPKKSLMRSEGLLESQQLYLKLKKEGTTKFRDFVFVKRSEMPRKAEIWIFEDKVEFYSTNDFVGGRIQNEALAETLRAQFNIQLEQAKTKEYSILSKPDKEFLKS